MTGQAPQIPRLRRAILTEPVRIYLYGVGTVAVLGLALAGLLTGDWTQYAITALGVILGLVPATEAARATTYAPATVAARLLAVSGVPARIPTPEKDTFR